MKKLKVSPQFRRSSGAKPGHHSSRPVAAYHQRGRDGGQQSNPFYAHDEWHEPGNSDSVQLLLQSPGAGYVHSITLSDIRQRIDLLPARFTEKLNVIQLSRMTRKRSLFPCYGMQWGPNVYLYPIEETLVETYVRPPRPQQIIETRMFGGLWRQEGDVWRLIWTEDAIRDFYLNNVLIHEIGHVNDERNTGYEARERYANWFAIEYGFRSSRKRNGTFK